MGNRPSKKFFQIDIFSYWHWKLMISCQLRWSRNVNFEYTSIRSLLDCDKLNQRIHSFWVR